MPVYNPPLRDMQFVMHEVLKVTDEFKAIPQHADTDARLSRAAYAVVWVNPLKGHPAYQPLAGGMQAALPFVDRFLPGHNLASLEELADVLAGIERRHAA